MSVNCKCPSKQCLFLGFAIAVLYLGMDMFFHHYCLGKLYGEHAALWRPMNEMTAFKWVGYLGYLLFGFLFVSIYAHGYEEGKTKWVQGFRYGLMIGLFYWGAHLLGSYPFIPWPDRIYLGWFAVGLFEFVALGLILSLLYKTKSA